MLPTTLYKHLAFPLVAVLLVAESGVASATTTTTTSIRGKQSTNENQSQTNGDYQHNDSSNNINTNNERCLVQSEHPDRMSSFPGWDQPLPSAWYSGCKYNDTVLRISMAPALSTIDSTV